MTRNIPEDDQLFRGLKSTVYLDDSIDNANSELMKEEVEVALATIPNGSLFGSSTMAVPWSIRLWVHNTFSNKESGFSKWMTRSFGKPPVLMSQVNPALHASVAQSLLRNYGYYRSNVSYETTTLSNPKKAKLTYSIRLDSLFTYDSIAYTNFPSPMQALIDSTIEDASIRRGDPFTLASLDAERSRLTTLFRNNGYFYYSPSYTSYLADTFAVANKAQVKLQLADGLPEEALRQWNVGNMRINLRRSMFEQLNDSIKRRRLSIHYNGKRPPIRARVLLKNMKLRPGRLFNYDNYQETISLINATGVFSNVDFAFTPRPVTNQVPIIDSLGRQTLPLSDTLDVTLSCTFDKPYNFYAEVNAIGRSIGRYGPEVRLGFTRKNIFRGGEQLDVNLHGTYEWQMNSDDNLSTYQYGADATVEFPRIIAPFYDSDRLRRDKQGRPIRRNYTFTPTTIAKMSADIIRRPSFYKMHVASGEWTYRWQSSANSTHEYSPLTLKYQKMNSSTAKFEEIIKTNPYLLGTMSDYFIPKMRYTYTYKSPAKLLNPIRWELTLEESGFFTSLWDVIHGYGFNEKHKKLFRTDYSQFLRAETDFTKTWHLTPSSKLVGHLNAGVIWCYGNTTLDGAPLSELFYSGGANSVRAFGVREIGPGAFSRPLMSMLFGYTRQMTYLMQNGELKFGANLEYRTKLFGNLHGALFVDVGNTWAMTQEDIPINIVDFNENDSEEVITNKFIYLLLLNEMIDGTAFKPANFFDQLAVGTGIGLRYDLGFLVIRLDWGIALHMPYYTGKDGYFNVPSFKEGQTLHFAIGYPF